VLVKI